MAVESVTMGYLKSRVSHILINTSTVPTALGTEIGWALHTALREFIDFTELQAFRKDADITTIVTPATKDYSLADDWLRMIEPGMYFTTTDFRTVDYMTEQEHRAFELERDQATSDPRRYILRTRDATSGAQRIRLWPTPSVVRVIRYHYLSLPVKVYDLADGANIDVRLPPDCHHGLVWGAVCQFGRYLNSNPELQIYVQKWEALKESKKEKAPAVGQSHVRTGWNMGRSYGRGYPFASAPVAPP